MLAGSLHKPLASLRKKPLPCLIVVFSFCVGPLLKSGFSSSEASPSVQENYAPVGACWVRPDWPAAEALSLPRKVCINKVGVIVPVTEGLPLGDGSALIVEGNPISGRWHINGAERRGEGWSVMGLSPSKRARAGACGELSEAAVAVYVDIDERGRIRETSLRIHGVLLDGSAECPKPADTVQILYTQSS